MRYLTISTLLLAVLVGAGCKQAEQIQADFNKSVENVKNEAANVQKKFEDTKKSIETNVQKVENLVNAVKAFSEDTPPEEQKK